MFKKTTHTKLIILTSLLPIVSFGIVGAISYYEINNFIVDKKWVEHTYQVIGQADDVENQCWILKLENVDI